MADSQGLGLAGAEKHQLRPSAISHDIPTMTQTELSPTYLLPTPDQSPAQPNAFSFPNPGPPPRFHRLLSPCFVGLLGGLKSPESMLAKCSADVGQGAPQGKRGSHGFHSVVLPGEGRSMVRAESCGARFLWGHVWETVLLEQDHYH